ncbi:MAG: hypothetical protein L0Y71_15010 [Gemmataceae bacterium]|nr:hypothetical protein [Gemmataceae bacterium]
MATAPAPQMTAGSRNERNELVVISHSSLFYWWPVWAVGFLMTAITWFGDQRLATVPAGTAPATGQEIAGFEGARDILVLPKGKHLVKDREGNPARPHMRTSANKNLGVLFCMVLLLVIAITNVPLRGLWSVIVIVILISLAVIFAILDWWEVILENLNFLDIRINMAGYLLISSVLFVLWLVIFWFFDRQVYMVFTPGQFRVKLEIGDAETAYDTVGMTIQKQRSDLFRHWILGLGSGDLIVRTAGAQAHQFDMPNVLFLGRRVREIEDMLRSKQVVAGQ